MRICSAGCCQLYIIAKKMVEAMIVTTELFLTSRLLLSLKIVTEFA